MSRGNSALASLTANYTDSEDEDDGLSPAPSPSSQDHVSDPDPDQGSSNSNSNSLIAPEVAIESQILKQPPSVGPSSSSNLVSYHVDGIEGQIDDEAIDDYPHSSSGPSSSHHDDESLPNSPHGGTGLELMDTDDGLSVPESSEHELLTSGGPGDESMSGVVQNENTDSLLSDPKRAKLPPEPQGKPDPKLQEKFTKMYQQKLSGKLNMNEHIQSRKQFRNPSIYEKLISHLNIDEFGTNYPENTYNPHEWPASSFWDELAKEQKIEMDRREKERKERTKVEFVSGTLKKPGGSTGINPAPSVGSTAPSIPATATEEPAKRKSKWDQKGVMPPLLSMTSHPHSHPQQPIVIPQSIVSSVAAATKAKTLINAFGNLPKKK